MTEKNINIISYKNDDFQGDNMKSTTKQSNATQNESNQKHFIQGDNSLQIISIDDQGKFYINQ